MGTLQEIEKKLKRRNYAPTTVKTYMQMLRKYARFCHQRQLNPKSSVQLFLDYLGEERYSVSTRNQAVNAVKFYYEAILGYEKEQYDIDRPMKERKLPKVLAKEEIKRIFEVTYNRKHLLILKIIYGCGLRISECIRLEIQDIDSSRMCILIRNAKGKKDRLVPLPESLLEEMRVYYKAFRPKKYLFEGQYTRDTITNLHMPPKPYTASSIRAVLKATLKRAKIEKPVTVHSLRHSYATHLLEMGVNLRSIQVILGHKSSKTTEIYTHISNQHIQNTPCPLDFL